MFVLILWLRCFLYYLSLNALRPLIVGSLIVKLRHFSTTTVNNYSIILSYFPSPGCPRDDLSTLKTTAHAVDDYKRVSSFNLLILLFPILYLLPHMFYSNGSQSTRCAEHGSVILTLGEYLSDHLTLFWQVSESHSMMMS